MTPRETIQNELTVALKARDTERVATLRLLLSALKNEAIAQGTEVDDAGFMRIVQKSIKQRKEAAELYDKGDRQELASKERNEAAILVEFLPPPVDESEIRREIEAFVAEESLEGQQAIGRVMKEMTGRYAGRADGATLSRIAREVLA